MVAMSGTAQPHLWNRERVCDVFGPALRRVDIQDQGDAAADRQRVAETVSDGQEIYGGASPRSRQIQLAEQRRD